MKKLSRRFFGKKTRRPQLNRAEQAHYETHREFARQEITARVQYWNQLYGFTYNRIAIKNHRCRWGSCSSLGNLNFNYKLVLLPSHLFDYVVVHELCHLQELHHGQRFWDTVAHTLPHYQQLVAELRVIERTFGTDVKGLIKAQAHYRSHATVPDSRSYDRETSEGR